jgi:hypothetical protein
VVEVELSGKKSIGGIGEGEFEDVVVEGGQMKPGRVC